MALVVPPRMEARLREYDSFHTQRGNELTHWAGIPLIIVGTASLLSAVTLVSDGSLSLLPLVLTGITLFYLIEARVLGLVTALAMGALAALGRTLPAPIGLGLFAVGWLLQLIGHAVYEKRSPAFLKNLTHLLVGPAWLVERLLRRTASLSDPQRS